MHFSGGIIDGYPLTTVALGSIESKKKSSCLRIMKLLIAEGADVNHVDDGLSVYEMAGSAAAQRLLRKHGARRGRAALEL